MLTFDVRVLGTGGASLDASVGGNNLSVLQGERTVLLLKL